MNNKFINVKNTSVLMVLVLFILISYIAFDYVHTSYDEYNKLVEEIRTKFSPKGFINITQQTKHIYSEITSYPSNDWDTEHNNAFKGNVLKPRQVNLFFSTDANDQIISKITIVYAPYSIKRRYLIVDYYEKLKAKAVIGKYKDILLTPYYQVGFQGKGYHIYVTSLYTEKYYKKRLMTINEKAIALEKNAELVRQLQDFLRTIE